MKQTLVAAAFCLILASFASAQSDQINIIPKPQSIKVGEGKFSFGPKTKIVATDDPGRKMAGLLNEVFAKTYGYRLELTGKPQQKNAIVFVTTVPTTGVAPNPGGYLLSIEKEFVRLSGSELGQFYALQSLMQLLPLAAAKEAGLPTVQIADEPRFSYRGMHLDVARHFMPVEFVKKYIDLMAQYKFNQFHWHLTEDQGWRIEIKKYPRLTEIGSKRPESHTGNYSPVFKGDGVPVEGFYTQEQIKDVVAYAKARYINVIPEIELPGHASAALAAYPKLGCKADYKYNVQMTWGIFKEVYCPTDETFKFLEDVLDETIALFPDSPYVHIGGDEVLKDHWKESPFVQDLMKRENLKDEHEVQSYFVRRIEKFINSKGKKMIGWDEILEGGLAPNATVMSWRGMKGGIEAAKSKHDVIMTPTDFCYLDYGQGDPAYEPINIGGYLTLEKVYSFEPQPKELTVDEAKYIIGGQGNIWTEYMKTPDKVEYMGFPRILALAEAVWSRPENRNFANFQQRLSGNLPKLDAQTVNYRIPEPLGLVSRSLESGEKSILELRPPVDGSKIYYTVDGSTPDEKSTQYTKPTELNVGEGGRVDVKAIVVLATGRKSVVYTATVLRRSYLKSAEPTEKRPGAMYSFVTSPSSGSGDAVTKNGETKTISLQQFATISDLKQPFSVSFEGYINVPTDGIYEIEIDSTWDATLLIGGEKVIDDVGSAARKARKAVVPLNAGWHKISLRNNHRGGEPIFRVRWAVKGQPWRGLGGGELVH